MCASWLVGMASQQGVSPTEALVVRRFLDVGAVFLRQ